MSKRVEVLEIEYDSARDFALDYRANLSSGGVFVPTQQTFAPRDFVLVRLRLPFCNRVIDLEGEIVHIVPAEMAGVGGRPGVAVQFREPPAGIRGRLGPLSAEASAEPPPAPTSDDSRRSARKSVRVDTHLQGKNGAIRGRTRNISHSGVLVDVQEGTAAIGERVRATLKNPANGDELAIDGAVVRVAQNAGRISSLAVQFAADAGRRRDEIKSFIGALQEGEHTRRLGAISGPIGELGTQSVVQMFASTARSGTIYLRHGEDEGVICFNSGVLRVARIGPLTGIKALVRMLCWKEGTFEFHSTVEESGTGDAPLPLQDALIEAARNIDESRRIETAAFPLQARLVARHVAEGQFTGALSKLEEALLDVAQAGFTVQRALEVIPEPDAEVFRALRSLIDSGMLELR